MKKSLMARIGAGVLTGSVFVLVPASVAQAEDFISYDNTQQQRDMRGMDRQGGSSMDQQDGRSTDQRGDMYESREPTSAGPQGPVRNDMMRDSGAYDSGQHRYERGQWGSVDSQWSDLRRQLGPIGGEGTN